MEKFKSLNFYLNKIIKDTLPYKIGKFRIVIRITSSGTPQFMAAEKDWEFNFGKEFRKVCYSFGYKLQHDNFSNFYTLYKDKSPRVKYYDIVKRGKPVSKRPTTIIIDDLEKE